LREKQKRSRFHAKAQVTAIGAEERLALAVYRPSAFVCVTRLA
jgi:hypothetical protein